MSAIPVIDLTPSLDGDPAGDRDVARQIDDACRSVGFFTVCGHGVPRDVIVGAQAASKRFFELPLAEKLRCRLPTGFTFGRDEYTPYGYSGLLEENAFAFMGVKGKPADYVEKYSAGKLVLDDGEALPFPDGALGNELRGALKAYYRACEALSDRLMRLFTISLGLPRDFFTIRTDQSADSLRSHLYPAFTGPIEHDQGMGAHTDSSLISLLTQTSQGIEVRIGGREWVSPGLGDVDHFLVNIGDLLSHWSNREYLSTEHRVVLLDQPRQSIVFFKLTNDDMLVEFGNKQMDALFGRDTV
ncbi:isopenicillin N synthase family dioxygenase [Burkholderia ubonensis]|uniref:isopenicillin N synthase family dioxygenase n=1 Tax=Burkholderia ubonensis TaxID=101571 RepID=UPI000757C52B|nr:2-oxoglutarate and iron-dependent oxygenase domain-containing protein [Burkholderia ubonensis]KVA18661.1 hypothetical protein WI43_20455 [Burkholderia ubonensis]KVA19237.1 hypothetical protein WI42_16200 [Burkholderia ubonensis]KVA40256.1 hypothetical protein WI46_14785 [Burkholderia ubonensis]